MNKDRWQQIKRIYNSALECESDKREDYLNEACGGDGSLRNEVEALLAHQREAELFMKAPAMEVAAQVLSKNQGKGGLKSLIGQSVAHYRIIEKIGEGGMGEVFLARDSTLDRKVALKLLPDVFASDPERLARFEREAKLLASLNHPNVAAIHGLEEADGKRFLVLELVEGQTLAERLHKGPLPIEETVDVCRQIAEGLEAAHEKGIIHRDYRCDSQGRTGLESPPTRDATRTHRSSLFMREIGQLEARALKGTEVASGPFWSPDGLWVGFSAGGKLMKAPIEGGAPIPLCDIPAPFGALLERRRQDRLCARRRFVCRQGRGRKAGRTDQARPGKGRV